MNNLEGLKDLKLKMDLQNVLYRYFADSARHFTKIEHCLRSGEAELLVVLDGEKPCPEGLNEAVEDFNQAVNLFAAWAADERRKVQKILNERIQCHEQYEWIQEVQGKAVQVFAFSAVSFLLPGVCLAKAVVVGSGGTAATHWVRGCSHATKEKTQEKLIEDLTRLADTEKHVFTWMRSLTLAFGNKTFIEALEKTQDILSIMNLFVQNLQTKGFVFDQVCWRRP